MLQGARLGIGNRLLLSGSLICPIMLLTVIRTSYLINIWTQKYRNKVLWRSRTNWFYWVASWHERWEPSRSWEPFFFCAPPLLFPWVSACPEWDREVTWGGAQPSCTVLIRYANVAWHYLCCARFLCQHHFWRANVEATPGPPSVQTQQRHGVHVEGLHVCSKANCLHVFQSPWNRFSHYLIKFEESRFVKLYPIILLSVTTTNPLL